MNIGRALAMFDASKTGEMRGPSASKTAERPAFELPEHESISPEGTPATARPPRPHADAAPANRGATKAQASATAAPDETGAPADHSARPATARAAGG
ncbi:hypothetical protein, partial [Cognatilysobacter segetis]|uniref:hypothetical protein n=1 Tax=Cognatilysobacter segetis TaxID=2492394 RepID=UPI00192E72AE